MSLCTLPTITEQRFADYLASGYSGAYSHVASFTADDFSLPSIVVKAAQFRPLEPATHLYEGQAVITVATQIDDATGALATHDAEVARVYDALADKAGALAFLNETGNSFYCHNFDIASFNQDRDDRALISELTLDLHAQTLEIA